MAIDENKVHETFRQKDSRKESVSLFSVTPDPGASH